jgi:hypothetical protein
MFSDYIVQSRILMALSIMFGEVESASFLVFEKDQLHGPEGRSELLLLV